MNILKKIKDKLYFYFAEKNWGVAREYGPYKDSHPEEHINHPWKLRWMLIRLNWHYRVLERQDILYYRMPEDSKIPLKLPYLDGAESKVFERKPDVWMAKGLANFDVVSFDIFDTLVLRPFAHPVDLFAIVGNKLGIMNYQEIRQQAERDAREEKRALCGTNEVTICDIYDIVARRTGIDADYGAKIEFETELEFCFGNPYMLRVFKILKALDKRVIIVSDMYYPHDMMARLLASCGYEGYDKLYVSCDYLCSKRSGGLFKNVLHDYANERIAHVGDNYESDIMGANRSGLTSFHYKNCHEIGEPYRADGMSPLVGSLYSGIINTYLHNGIKTYSPYYEYGFIYGGLYVFGFCNWIYQKAKKENIDKILFLARDGDVYQKVFNMLFDDMTNEYFYWSRIANMKATITVSRAEFLKRIIFNKAHLPIPISLGDLFRAVSLDFLVEQLGQYKLRETDVLTPELVPTVERFCIANWEKIVKEYEEEVEPMKRYLEGAVRGAQKVAVVDVGWVGSGPQGIRYLLEDRWKTGCEVSCYLAASVHPMLTYNINELMNGNLEPYMFSSMYNRNLFDVHKMTNSGMNNAFFELFTQANQPSFAGIDTNGEFQFDVAEVSNYGINAEIQQGIIDFCGLYNHFTRDNHYLRNIAGYDAYLPFRMLIRDPSFFKNVFSEYTFSFEIGMNARKQAQETLSDAMRQRNMI